MPTPRRSLPALFALVTLPGVLLSAPEPGLAQEPAAWGVGDPTFHTFSLVARDPITGELGAAVTTRNVCVGNGVPWVRVGVAALATQAATRTEYADEIFGAIGEGATAEEALSAALEDDSGADYRQLGVVAFDGSIAQHTGPENGPWAGNRSGADFATQGNVLVGPAVLDAVATTFAASAGAPRHLADRMIEAMEAGQAAGGDRRSGRFQSAAIVVADPRPGRARRPDGQTVHLNVCQHETPIGELRRLYDTVSQTLGFRTLERFSGMDVWQVKLLMHALGYYRSDAEELERGEGWADYDDEIVAAVEEWRAESGLSTAEDGSPSGLVDAEAVERMWLDAAEAGLADELRDRIRELTAIRR